MLAYGKEDNKCSGLNSLRELQIAEVGERTPLTPRLALFLSRPLLTSMMVFRNENAWSVRVFMDRAGRWRRQGWMRITDFQGYMF